MVNDPQIGHACGVFGVYAPGQGVAHLTYLGLYALQHRGQESAGIAVSDGQTITVSKDMGLVTQVFDERRLAPLDGHLAIGHVRYSTTGSSSWRNAQPVYRSVGDAGFALGHNGNLTNTVQLAEHLGMLPGLVPGDTGLDSTTDSALVAELMAHEYESESRSDGRDLERALLRVLPELAGGFSFVMMDEAHLIGVRDPRGFRPLSLGRLGESQVLSSESCAFDLIDATFVRDVEPGEMVVIGPAGVKSYRPFPPEPVSQCIFEYVYFSRPDSQVFGRSVHEIRKRLGRELAKEQPVDADVVVPVPDSGMYAGLGFSEQSRIPLEFGLVRNHYVGRTFIEPRQAIRHFGVKLKLNPVRALLSDKRVVLIDDSIVRGTTSRKIVSMVRSAGAREVHVRISCAPTVGPCYYGVDTPRRSELIASSHTVDEIRRYIRADSLGYLSLEGMYRAVGENRSFCTACYTNDYPVPFPKEEEAHGMVPGRR